PLRLGRTVPVRDLRAVEVDTRQPARLGQDVVVRGLGRLQALGSCPHPRVTLERLELTGEEPEPGLDGEDRERVGRSDGLGMAHGTVMLPEARTEAARGAQEPA